MARESGSASGGRLSSSWDAVRSSFGFLSGVAVALGLVVGFALPALDEVLLVDIPAFAFDSQDAARSVLETIATVTVAVAGLAFSVTVVAFTLAANQLSPRVLRSFRSDRLVQTTLATFLGTFIYCLVVLVRLGTVDEGPGLPNLSITVAVVLAIASFLLFATFIAHIVTMLEPSSVIEAIRHDGEDAIAQPYPTGIGHEAPEGGETPAAASRAPPARVDSEGQGYLAMVTGGFILERAEDADAVVRQLVPVGDYVIPDQPLAEIWAEDPEELVDGVRKAFVLAQQRSFVQDSSFAVRQLADVALKGLSPGINDPTTAENAIEAMTALLIRFAEAGEPQAVRCDEAGAPRFIARVQSFDEVVRLGFEQVRVSADSHPVVAARIVSLLAGVGIAAERHGVSRRELERQTELFGRIV